MKNIFFGLLAVVGIGLVALTFLMETPTTEETFIIPAAVGHVNDFGDVMSQEAETVLEAELKDFKPEIAVLTINNMNGLSIEDFSMKVVEQWKVGDADKDDGVIFILSLEDRDVRIEVGYGSEAKINDAKAGRILDENVIPHFKNGDWEGGILEGVANIKEALK